MFVNGIDYQGCAGPGFTWRSLDMARTPSGNVVRSSWCLMSAFVSQPIWILFNGFVQWAQLN